MNSEVVIKDVISPCSVCKNNKDCNNCTISKDNIIPSNFLADTSKITPFFVDSYYELLNNYTQLLNKLGLEVRTEPFELGD